MRDLEHLYTFGDMYDALDACAQVETILARLRRQNLLGEEAVAQSKRNVAEIRAVIENHMNSANIMPNAAPRIG